MNCLSRLFWSKSQNPTQLFVFFQTRNWRESASEASNRQLLNPVCLPSNLSTAMIVKQSKEYFQPTWVRPMEPRCLWVGGWNKPRKCFHNFPLMEKSLAQYDWGQYLGVITLWPILSSSRTWSSVPGPSTQFSDTAHTLVSIMMVDVNQINQFVLLSG